MSYDSGCPIHPYNDRSRTCSRCRDALASGTQRHPYYGHELGSSSYSSSRYGTSSSLRRDPSPARSYPSRLRDPSPSRSYSSRLRDPSPSRSYSSRLRDLSPVRSRRRSSPERYLGGLSPSSTLREQSYWRDERTADRSLPHLASERAERAASDARRDARDRLLDPPSRDRFTSLRADPRITAVPGRYTSNWSDRSYRTEDYGRGESSYGGSSSLADRGGSSRYDSDRDRAAVPGRSSSEYDSYGGSSSRYDDRYGGGGGSGSSRYDDLYDSDY